MVSTTLEPTRAALLELRRYRLRPGAREALVTLFERELVEPQIAAGMQVLGQFRDADEPDHFVWLRGYRDADPDARAEALGRFYGGPVWAEHRDAANATMLDSDDVLLLRPLGSDDWLGAVAADGQTGGKRPPVVATTCLLQPGAEVPDAAVAALSFDGVAAFVTADVPNRFPGLPVRDERSLVWLDVAGEGEEAAGLRRERVIAALGGALRQPPHVATLMPTSRSLLPLICDASAPARRSPPVWIRPAAAPDVPFLRGLAERAYAHYVERIGRRPAPMDADYSSAVRDGNAFVAEDRGGAIAFVVLVSFADHLLVENLAVEPARQGSGVGGALLAFAECCARRLGLPELRLYTNAAMTENLRFYPRRGYREVARRSEHGFDRVFFAKPTPA